MKIKATYLRKYRTQPTKVDGITTKPSVLVFVYAIKGTPEQLAKFKAVKGENYREDKDTKDALFFSQRFAGVEAEIILNKKETDWNIGNEEMELLANLTAQYGIEVASKMLAEMPK